MFDTDGRATVRANTHPFEQDGRLFAHNGVIHGLDAHLAEMIVTRLVRGDTDSERLFALITAETTRHRGDMRAGISAALEWVVANPPVHSVNFILTTRTDLWALRYPEANELWVLEHPGGGEGEFLEVRTDRIHARSTDLAGRPSVILASEPMNDDHRWRQLAPGEVAHVTDDLTVHTQTLLSASPAHPIALVDLAPNAASSQQPIP